MTNRVLNRVISCFALSQRLSKGLLVGFLLFGLVGCASLQDLFEPPVVSLTGIEILEANGFSVSFAVDLNIQNPNPVPIPITGLSYGLSLNGNEVLSGVSSEGINLGAFEETPLRLEASTNLFGMMSLLTDLMSNRTTEFAYDLEAAVGVSGFTRPLEVSESGVVPLTR